ncbi:energy-coupling factor transporter transmembrane component T family protein [Corynebacterium oculi]|uniref:Energy-coupling factor transporter transmembrane protein EcfT n=1 Tax=Corynebacterium oculi TaxID=1544416 RepID=A0A0Q0YC96_9CORY|nr:energy-coupling factor transporter transmembrane component T [Corynebacterium oculi]KQB83756.1 hypothetical protein Cocul_01828 [Corynebacterium oculi]
MHPLTSLSLAAGAWILVVGINSFWVSVACILLAWGYAAAATVWEGSPLRRVSRVPLWGAALSAPVAASMILIHAPHGQHRVAPLLTSDGLLVAAELTVRFLALVTVVLAATVSFRVADLAKALQTAKVPASLGYVVGATLHLAPEARASIRRIREANALAGRSTRGWAIFPRVVVPLMTTLMVRAAHSAETLETLGVGRKGPRTVLCPVPDSGAQRLIRWLAPWVCVAVVAGGYLL